MWHSVNSAKTMKMLDRWVNPDYDGRYKHGPHSLKSLEEGDLIEVWDRTDDPDDIRFYLKPHIRFYLKPHKTIQTWPHFTALELSGRLARSIAALAKPVEDNYTSICLRLGSYDRNLSRLVERGLLTVPDLRRMFTEVEKIEDEEDAARA